MKKIIFAIATVSTLLSGISAQAQNSKLVYRKSQHPVIEIELGNIMTNTTFYVKNEKGDVVKKGSISRNGKISLNTADLKTGHYRFVIAGVTQDFQVR